MAANGTDDATQLDWHDAASIGVEGKGWSDTPGPYHRLPSRAEGWVTEKVWTHGACAAGLTFEFETDSPQIWARWRLGRKTLDAGTHETDLCRDGLDLYARDDTGAWRWAGKADPGPDQQCESCFSEPFIPERRRYRIYLPLFNVVESLEIGVCAGSLFEGVAPRPDQPIAYYGTSIVHGRSASRPGMVHAAILGRRLDVPMLNLGFCGSAHMEIELARLMAELDPCIYMIDSLPNMGPEGIAERAEPFILALREKHPETPIVLIEDRTMAGAAFRPGQIEYHQALRFELRKVYGRLIEGGDDHLYYVPHDTLLGDDGDATTDRSHPSDLGYWRYAEALEPVLRRVLAGEKPGLAGPLAMHI